MNLLDKLTGGRPMRLTERRVFTDIHSGLAVNRYQDRLGRNWLANGPWSLFRVPSRW